jgi:hypothetical protein
VAECNVGQTDKWVRVSLGILIDLVAVFVPLAVGVKIVLLLVAAFGIGSGFLNFCPIYKIIGLSTCKAPDQKNRS